MIVDGICVQFMGCFDCSNKTSHQSDIQQINGVGRVQLDEDYYRELSTIQVSNLDIEIKYCFSNDVFCL